MLCVEKRKERKERKRYRFVVQFIPFGRGNGKKKREYGAKYDDGTEKLAGFFARCLLYGNSSGKHKPVSAGSSRVYELGKKNANMSFAISFVRERHRRLGIL